MGEKSKARGLCIAFADVAGNGVFQRRKRSAREVASAVSAGNGLCASVMTAYVRPSAKPRDAWLEESIINLDLRVVKKIEGMISQGKTVVLFLPPREVARFNKEMIKAGRDLRIATVVFLPSKRGRMEGKIAFLNPELFSEFDRVTIKELVFKALGPGFTFVTPTVVVASSGRGRRDFSLSFSLPNDSSEGASSKGGDPKRDRPEHYNAPEQLF